VPLLAKNAAIDHSSPRATVDRLSPSPPKMQNCRTAHPLGGRVTPPRESSPTPSTPLGKVNLPEPPPLATPQNYAEAQSHLRSLPPPAPHSIRPALAHRIWSVACLIEYLQATALGMRMEALVETLAAAELLSSIISRSRPPIASPDRLGRFPVSHKVGEIRSLPLRRRPRRGSDTRTGHPL